MRENAWKSPFIGRVELVDVLLGLTAEYGSLQRDLGSGKLKILSAGAQNCYQVRNYEPVKAQK